MEMETSSHFDWATDAYLALNDSDTHHASDKWPAFKSDPSYPQAAFSIPPSLLTQASVKRYGQITPPEELSPAEGRRDSARESSIPVEQLRNEPLWPDHHELQALQDYNPPQQPSLERPQAPEPSPRRRRTTRQAATNQSQDDPAPPLPQQDAANPQPPKRKRGRPKSQPQMVEAFTADGYPLQVSSARQSHLEKNRVAAHKCRQRKKEYINGLEGRAREFSTRNKALRENVAMLREEVLQLKNEVLRHAGCGFWAVDEYLARCAGDLLGMEAPTGAFASRKTTQTQSPATLTLEPDKLQRESSAESMFSQQSADSAEHEDYGGLDLLEDMHEEEDTRDA